jgi:hypothetical protein
MKVLIADDHAAFAEDSKLWRVFVTFGSEGPERWVVTARSGTS